MKHVPDTAECTLGGSRGTTVLVSPGDAAKRASWDVIGCGGAWWDEIDEERAQVKALDESTTEDTSAEGDAFIEDLKANLKRWREAIFGADEIDEHRDVAHQLDLDLTTSTFTSSINQPNQETDT